MFAIINVVNIFFNSINHPKKNSSSKNDSLLRVLKFLVSEAKHEVEDQLGKLYIQIIIY